jgi:uncharacterized protein (TIGR02270 family)
MHALVRPPITAVVQQHVDDAVSLRQVRSVLVRAPHVELHRLRRLDDRLAAHLDGLAVSGEAARRLLNEALAPPSAGSLFACTVLALDSADEAWLDRLLAVAGADPAVRRGVVSAFGWVSPQSLRGVTRALLGASSAWRRSLGLAACAMHGVDAGQVLAASVADGDAPLRRRALQVCAATGRVDLLGACLSALDDADPAARCAAACASVRLGERERGGRALRDLAQSPGPGREEAIGWLGLVLEGAEARRWLKDLSRDPADMRRLLRAIALVGDVHFVPWLIERMRDPALSRLAGESFALITGLDLAYLDLDGASPQEVVSGPDDDPQSSDVALDEDESLPWPDVGKIESWWSKNGASFTAGTRVFMGEAVDTRRCIEVLRKAGQRQRIVAARHLALQAPASTMFRVAAPAWRQERALRADADGSPA